MRKKVFYYDLSWIEAESGALSKAEKKVKAKLATDDPRKKLFLHLDLNDAIRILTNRQKQCFLLWAVEGFSKVEIAKKLGISHQTVGRHIKAACRKIRKFLT